MVRESPTLGDFCFAREMLSFPQLADQGGRWKSGGALRRCSVALAFSEESSVWRAFFFAVGIMLLIVGVELMFVDSATLGSPKTETVQVSNGWFQQPQSVQVANGGRVINPPEWMPWSFVFTGAVVVLYSFTLPVRWGNSGG